MLYGIGDYVSILTRKEYINEPFICCNIWYNP